MKINDTIGVLLGCRPDRKVLSIGPEQSVYEALQLLAKYDIGVLLVCSGDNCLVGIFSEGHPQLRVAGELEQRGTHCRGDRVESAEHVNEADFWENEPSDHNPKAGTVTLAKVTGIREGAGMKLYIAYLRDPDGNKICALHRMP